MKYATFLCIAVLAASASDKSIAPFSCSYTQTPDKMYAWALDHPPAGIPSIHYETRTIDQGSHLGCNGIANDNRAGCTLTYSHGGVYTFKPHWDMRSPTTDSVQLNCLGTNPCCAMEVSPDPHPISSKDRKPHPLKTASK